MNLVDLCDLGVPATVDVVGTRMSGKVAVQLARASDLSRSVRFGAGRFGEGNIVSVNGCDLDIAGLTAYETPEGWRCHPHGAVRRPTVGNSMGSSKIPPKAIDALAAWAITAATRLGEQFPTGFGRLGFTDDYTCASQVAARIVHLQSELRLMEQYHALHVAVEAGAQVVAPDAETPARLRWKTPDRNCNIHPLDQSQPRRVSGRVMDGDLLIGYAVDTRKYEYNGEPDCYAGPLLVPLDCCWEAEEPGKVQRWVPVAADGRMS